MFLHEAVAESLYLGVKPIKTRDFEAVYTLMLENDTSSGEIGLEQQFLVTSFNNKLKVKLLQI